MDRDQEFPLRDGGRNDVSYQVSDAELINPKDLARLLSVSERTLYRLKSAGELPLPVILRGNVRWRLSEIRFWIEQGCPRPEHKTN